MKPQRLDSVLSDSTPAPPARPRHPVIRGIFTALLALMILGILASITLPTFNHGHRAWDKASQSSLRNTLVAATVAYRDNDDFSSVSPETLAEIEPTLTYTEGPSDDIKVVSIAVEDVVADGGRVAPFAAFGAASYQPDSERCWLIRTHQPPNGETTTTYGMTEGDDDCSGQAALRLATADSW